MGPDPKWSAVGPGSLHALPKGVHYIRVYYAIDGMLTRDFHETSHVQQRLPCCNSAPGGRRYQFGEILRVDDGMETACHRFIQEGSRLDRTRRRRPPRPHESRISWGHAGPARKRGPGGGTRRHRWADRPAAGNRTPFGQSLVPGRGWPAPAQDAITGWCRLTGRPPPYPHPFGLKWHESTGK